MKRQRSASPPDTLPTELAIVLSDIRSHRKRCNLNQTEYWRLYGTSQSGGCRYEQSREPPRPVLLLMALVAMGRVSNHDLVKADAYVERSLELVDHTVVVRAASADKKRKNLNEAISALARVGDAGIEGIDHVREQLNGVLDSLSVRR